MKQVSHAMSGLVAISRMTLVGAYHATSVTCAVGITNHEGPMGNPEQRIHIQLTEDQRKQIKDTSGKDVIALDFSVEELEQRIAPTGASYNTWGWDIKANKGA
jgi:hypothetical protein